MAHHFQIRRDQVRSKFRTEATGGPDCRNMRTRPRQKDFRTEATGGPKLYVCAPVGWSGPRSRPVSGPA
eukprot:4745666-Karenia_brevis.AAC.1